MHVFFLLLCWELPASPLVCLELTELSTILLCRRDGAEGRLRTPLGRELKNCWGSPHLGLVMGHIQIIFPSHSTGATTTDDDPLRVTLANLTAGPTTIGVIFEECGDVHFECLRFSNGGPHQGLYSSAQEFFKWYSVESTRRGGLRPCALVVALTDDF